MDLLTAGLNLSVIVAIIAITQVIKTIDMKNVLKQWYVLIPLVLGIIAAIFMTTPWVWKTFGLNAIIYAGVSSYLYQAGTKLLIGGQDTTPPTAPTGSAK